MSADLWMVLAAFLALLAVAAFLSGSETALTTASRGRLSELGRRGNRRAAQVLKLVATREKLVGALLLGRTAAAVAAATLATFTMARFHGGIGAAAAAAAVIVVILSLGETLPRTMAILRPERFALFAAPPLGAVVAVLGPPVLAIEAAVKRVLRVFRFDVSKAANVLSAHDELRGAIDLHLKEGAVVKKDRDMLGGVLDLKELEVFDVMVHRTKMVTAERGSPPKEIIAEALRSGHSRLPVWHEQPDNIVGILHAKDLLKALFDNGGEAEKIDIEALLTPPWFVPDTRAAADQLNAFLRRKQHSAIVVDEYGEVMGLITLEDILEEIVGEIADEHDPAKVGIRPQADGSFIIDGAAPIRDLNRTLEWELPDGEATTLAGLVIHEARTIPQAGQVFTFHGIRFEVLRKRRNQVTAIRASPLRRDE